MAIFAAMDHLLVPLSNGMHLIYKQVTATEIAHAGFVVNAGSRDELSNEAGLAHFLEHMLFKGTQKRKAFHVLSRLDAVGGDLNAYTTKERTCLHASFRNIHFNRSFELLTDIFFNASFPEKELKREKQVVLEEILMYQDEYDESILDDFEKMVFRDRALGNPILGTAASVGGFDRDAVVAFRNRNYGAENTVFAYVGPMPWKQFEKKVRPMLESYTLQGKPNARRADYIYQAERQEVEKSANNAYFITGSQAYAAQHPNRLPLLLLNNLLGGENMNSRLNMSIRERNGLVYGIESNFTPFSDIGLFFVYFSADWKHVGRVQKLIDLELNKLCKQKVGTVQLHMAKQQFISRLLMSEENRANLMLSLAHHYFDHQRIDTLAEIIQRIESIQASELLDIANELLDPRQMSTLIYKPA